PMLDFVRHNFLYKLGDWPYFTRGKGEVFRHQILRHLQDCGLEMFASLGPFLVHSLSRELSAAFYLLCVNRIAIRGWGIRLLFAMCEHCESCQLFADGKMPDDVLNTPFTLLINHAIRVKIGKC